jgi:hypothetical protein
MKARVVGLLAVALGAAAAPAAAQCTGSSQAMQACSTARDLLNYMTPQMATSIAGGSSTLGQSGSLGGLGRFALSIRGTGIINGGLPQIGDAGFDTTNAKKNYTVKDQIIPGVGVDAAIGIWKGFNLGATHVGGVDLLVSALYLPDVEGSGNDFSIKAKDGNLKLGYGVRVGVLDEGVATPGVYVSYLQRDLPTVSLTGHADASGSGVAGDFALNDFAVKTTAYRLVASKNFLMFGLQAGVGQDKYESSASLNATVTAAGQSRSASGTANMSMTRNNMFAAAIINFFVTKLVVEAGQVSGGSFPTLYNTFDKKADDSRTYVSGGLRIAF